MTRRVTPLRPSSPSSRSRTRCCQMTRLKTTFYVQLTSHQNTMVGWSVSSPTALGIPTAAPPSTSVHNQVSSPGPRYHTSDGPTDRQTNAKSCHRWANIAFTDQNDVGSTTDSNVGTTTLFYPGYTVGYMIYRIIIKNALYTRILNIQLPYPDLDGKIDSFLTIASSF